MAAAIRVAAELASDYEDLREDGLRRSVGRGSREADITRSRFCRSRPGGR